MLRLGLVFVLALAAGAAQAAQPKQAERRVLERVRWTLTFTRL